MKLVLEVLRKKTFSDVLFYTNPTFAFVDENNNVYMAAVGTGDKKYMRYILKIKIDDINNPDFIEIETGNTSNYNSFGTYCFTKNGNHVFRGTLGFCILHPDNTYKFISISNVAGGAMGSFYIETVDYDNSPNIFGVPGYNCIFNTDEESIRILDRSITYYENISLIKNISDALTFSEEIYGYQYFTFPDKDSKRLFYSGSKVYDLDKIQSIALIIERDEL